MANKLNKEKFCWKHKWKYSRLQDLNFKNSVGDKTLFTLRTCEKCEEQEELVAYQHKGYGSYGQVWKKVIPMGMVEDDSGKLGTFNENKEKPQDKVKYLESVIRNCGKTKTVNNNGVTVYSFYGEDWKHFINKIRGIVNESQ